MEKIKVNGKIYEIRSIQTISTHVLQIAFVNMVPVKWGGDIVLYTAGDIECATLSGWNTVYRDEGQTVYLSDDGSVYQTPDPDTGGEILPPEPYEPTLAELQVAKKQEVNAACNKTIVEGFDVALSDGTHHFTMKEEDQIAFLTCLALISKGETAIPWHPNGSSTQPCVFYSTDDMQKITDAAYEHRTFHTTYCNSLKIWVEATETAEELQEIYYGADVPETYQSDVLKAYLKAKESVGGTDESEAVR